MKLETDAAVTAMIVDTMMALISLDVNGDFKTGTSTTTLLGAEKYILLPALSLVDET